MKIFLLLGLLYHSLSVINNVDIEGAKLALLNDGYYLHRNSFPIRNHDKIRMFAEKIKDRGTIRLYNPNPNFHPILDLFLKNLRDAGVFEIYKSLLGNARGDICFVGSAMLWEKITGWHRDTLRDSKIDDRYRHFVTNDEPSTKQIQNKTDTFQIYKSIIYLQDSEMLVLENGHLDDYDVRDKTYSPWRSSSPSDQNVSKLQHIHISKLDIIILDLRIPHSEVSIEDRNLNKQGQFQITFGNCRSTRTKDQFAWIFHDYEVEMVDINKDLPISKKSLNFLNNLNISYFNHMQLFNARPPPPPLKSIPSTTTPTVTTTTTTTNTIWKQINESNSISFDFNHRKIPSHLMLFSYTKRVELEVGLGPRSERYFSTPLDKSLTILAFDPLRSHFVYGRSYGKILSHMKRNPGNATRFLYFPVGISTQPMPMTMTMTTTTATNTATTAAITTTTTDPHTIHSTYNTTTTTSNIPLMIVKNVPACATMEIGHINSNERLLQILQSIHVDMIRCIPSSNDNTDFILDVPVITLQSLLTKIPTAIAIDLLKVDVQGHEMSVLESATMSQLQRIRRILLTLQDIPMEHFAKMYTRQPNVTMARQRLQSLGYDLKCCRGSRAKLWQTDCLFVRKTTNAKDTGIDTGAGAGTSSPLWRGDTDVRYTVSGGLFHSVEQWRKERLGVYDKDSGGLLDSRADMDLGLVSYDVCL
eukprot:gene8678-17914_t